MKSRFGYDGHFFQQLRGLQMSSLEKTILISLILMCVMSAVDAFNGRLSGNHQQLRMAKLQAQQELMALRANQGG
jgi:hypothetical protein